MSALPTGIVTFLFTDMEGSTRLWETYPDAMRLALSRHDTLLREIIEANRGFVFKTVGDAFHAAFASAGDAVAAALTIQRRLQEEVWPDPLLIKVRISLHTGAADARDNDYFGVTLNRLARLMTIGHGGQVLLSLATCDLVRDSLPPETATRPLGSHQLKDLQQPEQVFQLIHSALPADFPPLRSLTTLPTNLPVQSTSFVGREVEIQEIQRLLTRTRLLTLTGSGGCGKTRLMLQVAADLLGEDGVWLIELAPLSDPALIPQAIATVLGVKEEPGQPILQTLLRWLKSKRLLLLLDNGEHLLAACARFADTVLKQCPEVRLLVTSREALGVSGEQTYRVPSLGLPPVVTTLRRFSLTDLGAFEAVRLFVDRAAMVRADYRLTAENAPALTAVCRRLDGIPMAIELAAARVRSLSVEEINDRLDNRFRLLTGGNRTALPRHQTLRSMIDWSYDLLNDQEKTLLHRLAVFTGGWSLEAAESVCSDETLEDWEVLDVLASLVDKSLVLHEPRDDQTRYRLLETVREYAAEKLTASGESAALYRRHRDYYLLLAEEAELKMRGEAQAEWLLRLRIEHDNLRLALDESLADPNGADDALRMSFYLRLFWLGGGLYSEGTETVVRALEKAKTANGVTSLLLARALHAAGMLQKMPGNFTQARAYFEQAIQAAAGSGDAWISGASRGQLGDVALCQGDYSQARTYLEAGIPLLREAGDERLAAIFLGTLGDLISREGDSETALRYLQEALTLNRRANRIYDVANTLMRLAQTLDRQGDCARAHLCLTESLEIMERLEDQIGIAHALYLLGLVRRQEGKLPLSRSALERALALSLEARNEFLEGAVQHGLAMTLLLLGEQQNAWTHLAAGLHIALRLGVKDCAEFIETAADFQKAAGETERAVVLTAAAGVLRHSVRQVPTLAERLANERRIEVTQTAMEPEAFQQAWAQGLALGWEEAMAFALEALEGDSKQDVFPPAT